MAEGILDASVLVGYLDANDVQHAPASALEVLDMIEATAGALKFNDGLLVVLQRNAVIDDVASFDEGFDAVAEFRRLA